MNHTQPRKRWVGALFQRAPVVRVYDALTHHQSWAEQNAQLVQRFMTPLPKGARLLDLGCGTGVGSLAIARALRDDVEVLGVDFSAKMVALASQRYEGAHPRLSFAQADATDMVQFTDGSFDAVVANSFLYLVPNAERVLREVFRILQPGGQLVFMEPREEARLGQVGLRATRRLLEGVRSPFTSARLALALSSWRLMSGLEGRMPASTLRSLFLRCGFEQVAIRETLGGLGQHVIAMRPLPECDRT